MTHKKRQDVKIKETEKRLWQFSTSIITGHFLNIKRSDLNLNCNELWVSSARGERNIFWLVLFSFYVMKLNPLTGRFTAVESFILIVCLYITPYFLVYIGNHSGRAVLDGLDGRWFPFISGTCSLLKYISFNHFSFSSADISGCLMTS